MSISISWPFLKCDCGLTVITYGINTPYSRHAIGYRVITHNFKSHWFSNIFGIDFKVVYTTGKFEKNWDLQIYPFKPRNHYYWPRLRVSNVGRPLSLQPVSFPYAAPRPPPPLWVRGWRRQTSQTYSGAPWVKKLGNLRIREILVASRDRTSAPPPVHSHNRHNNLK